ncbi:FAD-dependent monooxygenase [Thalassospira sp. MCCC 1A01428]|uniref:FAD-dependent monooxygenase n=1 Tax=Thalassospira sp. MCCC 1A01428 TaxID=1470575 RepID=UPI00210F5C25|nr:FAD-dependent monooxygenase [Thalassospira sp. MCCC 1A01428]
MIIGWRLVGLLLSRLLHALGISLVILARKSRANAEGRIRAGMPEMGTVDQMCAAGVDGQRFLPGDDISAASFWG